MDKLIEAIAKNLGVIGLLVFLTILAILSALREIARIRVDVVKQKSGDLMNRRFAAYGALWSRMNELAIYCEVPFDEKVAQCVRDKLTTWYFSADGGMLLSATARDFYFGLQEILGKLAQATLVALPRNTDPRGECLRLLGAYATSHPESVQAFSDKHPESMPADQWLSLCKALAADVLSELAKNPQHGSGLAFCLAQQASSALRSRLALEVQSRLDLAPTWWRFW